MESFVIRTGVTWRRCKNIILVRDGEWRSHHHHHHQQQQQQQQQSLIHCISASQTVQDITETMNMVDDWLAGRIERDDVTDCYRDVQCAVPLSVLRGWSSQTLELCRSVGRPVDMCIVRLWDISHVERHGALRSVTGAFVIHIRPLESHGIDIWNTRLMSFYLCKFIMPLINSVAKHKTLPHARFYCIYYVAEVNSVV